jgi:hypothetical protein
MLHRSTSLTICTPGGSGAAFNTAWMSGLLNFGAVVGHGAAATVLLAEDDETVVVLAA